MQKLTVLFSLATLLLFSCTKDNTSAVTNDDVTGSKWIVDYYFDSDKDETAEFDGYSFEFKSDGSFVATLPDASTVTGAWSSTTGHLTIQLSGNQNLDDVDNDWLLIDKSADLIKVKDDNTSSLEEMHFKRL